MPKYLDQNGLLYFWQKIKAKFVSDVAYDSTNSKITKTVNGASSDIVTLASSSSSGLLSSADKTKLDGIATGANAYTHPTYTARTGKPTANATPAFGGTVTVSQITSDATGHVTAATDRTITIPSAVATTSAAGLMSSADKTKLDGIATGAEVNQNAFSNVKVGSTTVAADGKTDTLELVAGSNVTLTPDATNDKVTIAATDTTYSAATTSAAGLMSAADKTKLDGIAEGAEAVSVTTSGSGNVVSAISESGGAITVTKGVTALTSHQVITQDGVTGANGMHFAECTTAAATAVKTATIQGGTIPSNLHDGTRVIVYFTNTNSATSPKLKVNDGSAYAIACGRGVTSFDPTILSGPVEFIFSDDKWTIVGMGLTKIHATGSGNVVTAINNSSTGDGSITLIKTTTALTSSQLGAANGVCPLNANSVIDSQYLPSYVDDIIEAYEVSGSTELGSGWLSETSGGTALTPETGKIYVLMADSASTTYGANTQFRWSGTSYVKLNDGGVSAITNAEIDTIVAA